MTNDFNMPVTPHRLELMDGRILPFPAWRMWSASDESGVFMTTSAGTLIVTGEDLHIGKLSLEGGELYVDGRVTSISYEDHSEPSGRLFQPSVRIGHGHPCHGAAPHVPPVDSAGSGRRGPGTTCCGRCGCGTPD